MGVGERQELLQPLYSRRPYDLLILYLVSRYRKLLLFVPALKSYIAKTMQPYGVWYEQVVLAGLDSPCEQK